MAGSKQKNIKILYQVDTSQVKAAEATVSKAKAATDNLTKSTKQLADQSKATGVQFKQSIGATMTELERLRTSIESTAQSDKKRLAELIPQYQKLKAEVAAFNKQVEGTAKANAAIGVSLGGVYNAVRLALTAGLIREAANAAIEMTALAGKIEGVKRAFDKLPNSILLMEELKQRTHGALTELELMQKALQARNFGIPIEQLGKLLEFAAIKSQQTGISIQYLTDSIVTGLGRESIKILDNLQIDIGKLKARMQETGLSMREVVGDIVNEELKKMGGYLETGETRVNRLKTAWTEFGAEVSQALDQSGAIQYLTELVQTADAFVESRRRGVGMNQVFAEKDGLKRAAADILRFKEANKELLADREKNIGVVQQEINAQDKLAASNKLNIMILREELKETLDINKINAMREQIQQREFAVIKTNQYIDVLKQYHLSLKLTNNDEKDNTVTIKSLNEQIEKYNEQITESVSIHDTKKIESLLKLKAQTEAYRDALLNLNKVQTDSESEPLPKVELTGDLSVTKIDYNELLEESTRETWEELERIREQGLKDEHDIDVQDIKDKEKWAKDRERIMDGLTNLAIRSAHDILSAWNEAQDSQEEKTLASLERQLDAFNEYSDNVMKTAGDNERRKVELEVQTAKQRKELEAKIEQEQIAADKREAEREKKERLRQIAIDTAAGIVRALTIAPGIGRGGGLAAGILAVEGVVQAGIVNKFKDGVIDLQGPGNETSDSIPAMLSRRESVMTAAETKGSMGILKDIRAKKLDDRIFDKLVVRNQSTDLGPLLNETIGVRKSIERNKPSDPIRQGYFVYEMREVQKGVKRKIKKASFG